MSIVMLSSLSKKNGTYCLTMRNESSVRWNDVSK
jgi:hypothetical protein